MDMPLRTAVSSREFVSAMEDRWRCLGNVASDALRSLWSTMAATFATAIDGAGRFVPDNTWRVLEPPTGTGKTQGVCVYASLVMRKNVLAAHPLTMLVVTRTIAQADEIVATVRELVGNDVPGRRVVARHSENRTTAAEMRAADVLVICHEAYVRSLAANRWQDYVETDRGPRLLTIIDEALAGIIDERRLTTTGIERLLGYLVSARDEREFAAEIAALRDLRDILEQLGNSTADASPKMRVVWRDGTPFDLARLRNHMTTVPFDIRMTSRRDANLRRSLAALVDDDLRAAEGLLASWAYYARERPSQQDALFNADLIVPPHLPGVVVLDATSRQNMLWTLMQPRAVRVPVPAKTRLYDRVTLHVARTASGLGKGAMREHGRLRVNRLVEALAQEKPGASALVVLHKTPGDYATTLSPQGLERYGVATYGAIDGKNNWHDFDTVAILGMFNRPDTWSRNAFMALQGVQTDEWLNEPSAWREFTDVRREMERRQLTVSIVQAMNRVRCRRVVDADGRCDPTDVYLVLPANGDGDAVLANVLEEMPGVVVVPWAFEPDGPATNRAVQRGSFHEAVVAILSRVPDGTTVQLSELQRELGLSPRNLRDLRETLRDDGHPLTQRLDALGVAYKVVGRGRGSRSMLTKAWPP